MGTRLQRGCFRRASSLLGAIAVILASGIIAGWLPSAAGPAGPTTVPASPKKKTALGRPDGKERDERRASTKPASTTQPKADRRNAAARPDETAEPREASKESPTTSKATSTAPTEQAPKPEVEVFFPSLSKLRQAAGESRTADLYRELVRMLPAEPDDTGEGMDLAAIFDLIHRIGDWPDTSMVLVVFKQDREGRPRWAIRLDWPVRQLAEQVEELLDADASRQLLKEVRLNEAEDGSFRIELPDHLLAVLSAADGHGSLIASAADVKPPAIVFGQPTQSEKADGSQDEQKKPKRPLLVYSRLNLDTGESDGSSPFAALSGVRDICYGLSLGSDGLWSERVVVRWNLLVGTALKMAFRKTDKPFECPRKSYCAAAFNLAMGEGLADGLSGLTPGTIGNKAGSGAAIAIVPGSGFLPFPDVFYQFHTSKKDQIIQSIREAIEQDTKQRKAEDKPPAWREQQFGEEVIFWRDPTADRAANLMPVTYRTVLFFDVPAEGESGRTRLVIAQASTRADQAVAHWRELMRGKRSRITLPDSTKAHWQGRINWSSAYALVQPYLCVLVSLAEDSLLPPTTEELAETLVDSVVDIRIEYGGLQIRHSGPIPIGAFYVPGIVAASLSSSASARSEAGREQIACRHLRVLHHHAKLFKKDYGRWPATVAELDGYVDFASHPHLLYLYQQDRSFVERFAAAFTTRKQAAGQIEDGEIDDSLYRIDWAPDDWRLSFRDGEFKNYVTISIDMEGEIHRTPKPATTQDSTAGVGAVSDK